MPWSAIIAAVRRNRNKTRPTHVKGTTAHGEAWLQLIWVKRQLGTLEKLAYPDHFQSFVWGLNEFVTSARKVINYLKSGEANRRDDFRIWFADEERKLLGDPRFKFFCDLRNISDKDCPIVPRLSMARDVVVTELVVSGSKNTPFKHPETGETIMTFKPLKKGVPDQKIKIRKRVPVYVLSAWPDEDVLTFLRNIVLTFEDFVNRAYSKFPERVTSYLVKANGRRSLWVSLLLFYP